MSEWFSILNQSEKCIYNPNLIWIRKIKKKFVYLYWGVSVGPWMGPPWYRETKFPETAVRLIIYFFSWQYFFFFLRYSFFLTGFFFFDGINFFWRDSFFLSTGFIFFYGIHFFLDGIHVVLNVIHFNTKLDTLKQFFLHNIFF